MSGGRGKRGNREVSPCFLLSARGDLSGAGAEAILKEGGSWGKHGFPHGSEPDASDAHACLPEIRMRWLTASIVNRPNPAIWKIVSVITAPEISAPSWRPITVVTVIRLFLRACRPTTLHSLRPFARAVRM